MTTVHKTPVPTKLRKVFIRILIVVCVFLAVAKVLFPGLSAIKTTGPFSFDSVVVQINDNSRLEAFLNDGSIRKLSLKVYYPTDKSIERNSCPLVVFSHGGISVKTSNASLFEELASHGFVVASIAHPYHALYASIDGKKVWIDRDYFQELNMEDSNKDIANSYMLYKKWMGIRMADINQVINTIIAETRQPGNSFYSLINPQNIGLAGHSLGGAAVLGTARMRDDISAVIALEAPYMYDITGYSEDEFTWNTEPYKSAVMNVYSDTGYMLIGNDNKYAQNANYLYNNGKAINYHIPGSNHFTLTDLVRTSPALCKMLGGNYSKPGYETLEFINEISLEFLSQYMFPQT
ncbi:hypothetical protein GC105_11140 [Alkalibaculum sp. M08DMB]|uniref:Alpha/beta hydrolase n=1 Tax=Alkalibaculum sporogenes TaxID=2655001 RepID=A0A6A7KBG1_9FIRM|nr:hypothetical protein [Alkalibaculum sporogenes]MPW26343.1 hypothetical protein [Alkalibaculum sporogenes]